MAGAVQLGASTLLAELFVRFPRIGACEIHLATEFQNMIYDHPAFPKDVKSAIYEKLRTAAADERKPGDTDEQFFYKTRKKALGPFKQDMWDLPAGTRGEIADALEKKFVYLFEKLAASGTRPFVERWVRPPKGESAARTALGAGFSRAEDDLEGE